MINNVIRKENKPVWFVMRCRDAGGVESLVEAYNADPAVSPDERIEDWFIPAVVTHQRIGLAFLFVRPSAFDERNRCHTDRYWYAGRMRLGFYTDGKGEAITVRPELMRLFINGCLEYREHLEVHAKATEIVDGIEVTVRRGTFADYKAEVYNVRYRAGGIRFSIAIKFFADDGYVHIHDLSPEDVRIEGQEETLFGGDFIERIESSLLEILGRQVNRKETAESREADLQQLRQLYWLRHAIIDDPQRAAQFDALMSICASLMGSSTEKRKYNRIVKQRIKGIRNENENQNENTVPLAYLLTALYISTKDADYRTELKKIVLEYLPDHQPLRAFLSLVRKY